MLTQKEMIDKYDKLALYQINHLAHHPYEHDVHKFGIECGCAHIDDYIYICPNCSAVYNNVVLSFLVFRCYDCGGTEFLERTKVREALSK